MSDKELFDTYNREVYRTCLYLLGNAADAEDVCQEVFIRVFRHDWRNVEHLKAWIMKIAVNLCMNQIRKNRQIQAKHRLFQVLHITKEQTTERIIEEKEKANELAGLLSALPGKIRAAVTLRYLNEMSTAEISEVLQIPVGTVKSRIHKGLRLLRETAENPLSKGGAAAYDKHREALTTYER